jgi:23S rRNA (cytidine2498-2'-O)-methyltransferase
MRGNERTAQAPPRGPRFERHQRNASTDSGRLGGLAARDPAADRELSQLMAATNPPAVGDWLWTTREGAERDCIEELLMRRGTDPKLSARGFAPGLVVSSRAARDPQGRLDLTFARQGFAVQALARDPDERGLAQALAKAAALLIHSDRYALHVFVPDTETGNRLAQRAERISEQLALQLRAALPSVARVDAAELRRSTAELVQVCVCTSDLAALGVVPSDQALSIWPGGRARMKLGADRPSRSARKLEEALVWLGTGPEAGELCVDLGAAPGGWTWLLLNRRARVIAVDPARMEPRLLEQRRLRHVQGSAFDWQPEEPADWLFCDMAWRPLEVAQMLGRWARLRQTRMLVANFKLPMKRKAEMVARLCELLGASGYRQLRTRQLYHDREEITVTGRV